MVSRLGLAPVRNGALEVAASRPRAIGRAQPSWLLRATFIAFVSSLPFEAALQFGDERLVSIPRLLGYLVFAVALLQPRLCFGTAPRALWWFGLYLLVEVVSGSFSELMAWEDLFDNVRRVIQFLLLLLIGYNLFRYDRVVRWCLWGFGFGCVAMSALLAAGVGAGEYHNAPGRETIFGVGPNTLGATIALGAVALIGMVYGRGGVRPLMKACVWGGFIILAIAVARTGSRGSLLAMTLGLLTLVASRGSTRMRIRNVLMVMMAFGLCAIITISFTSTAQRWQSTLEEGDTSGRDVIFRSAWQMFKERPILGWGPAVNQAELGYRLDRPRRDTHNLLLWLLTEVGLVGTLPFCVAVALAVRGAWRGRKGTQGLVPLALVVAVLTTNLSGTNHGLKWFWVILAYALASETYVRGRSVARSNRRFDALGPIAATRLGQLPASAKIRGLAGIVHEPGV